MQLCGILANIHAIASPLVVHYHQQNKCYPQWCLLVDFEASVDFSRSEFTCPVNIINQICYCGKI